MKVNKSMTPPQKKTCMKQFISLSREFALFLVKCISSFGCLNMMTGRSWTDLESRGDVPGTLAHLLKCIPGDTSRARQGAVGGLLIALLLHGAPGPGPVL